MLANSIQENPLMHYLLMQLFASYVSLLIFPGVVQLVLVGARVRQPKSEPLWLERDQLALVKQGRTRRGSADAQREGSWRSHEHFTGQLEAAIPTNIPTVYKSINTRREVPGHYPRQLASWQTAEQCCYQWNVSAEQFLPEGSLTCVSSALGGFKCQCFHGRLLLRKTLGFVWPALISQADGVGPASCSGTPSVEDSLKEAKRNHIVWESTRRKMRFTQVRHQSLSCYRYPTLKNHNSKKLLSLREIQRDASRHISVNQFPVPILETFFI